MNTKFNRSGADPCSDKTSEGEIKVYEAGEEWSPDPCTFCHCVETGTVTKPRTSGFSVHEQIKDAVE